MTNSESPQELLCRWIYHSGNKATSDRHFNAYYNAVAGPGKALYNHAHRLSESNAEDFLQKALYDFVKYVKERPEFARLILQILGIIGLPAKGEFFQRRTRKWADDSEDWTQRIMSFCGENCGKGAAPVDLIEHTRAINSELLPLRKRGADLLSWAIPESDRTADIEQNSSAQTEHDEEEGKLASDAIYHAIKRLAKRVSEWLKISEAYADEMLGVAGGAGFVLNIDTLLRNMPKLKVPFTKLLFKLVDNHFAESIRGKDAFTKGNPIATEEEDESGKTVFNPEITEKISVPPDPFIQGASEIELADDERYWELIHDRLYAPVQQARLALFHAKTKGERTKARILIEKCQDDYAEQVALLELWLQDKPISGVAREIDLDRKTVSKRLNELWTLLAPLTNI